MLDDAIAGQVGRLSGNRAADTGEGLLDTLDREFDHVSWEGCCRFSFSVRPDIAGFFPPRSRPVNRSWYDNLGRRISLCFGGEITQDLTSMRARVAV